MDVVALLFYHITSNIEFLCQFKISKFENLGRFLHQIFLWVASRIKNFLTYFDYCEITKVSLGWVCYVEFPILQCVIFKMLKKNIRCDILPA